MKLILIIIVVFGLLPDVQALNFDILGFLCAIFPFNILLFFLCPADTGEEGDPILAIEINGPGAAFPGQDVEFTIVVTNAGEY